MAGISKFYPKIIKSPILIRKCSNIIIFFTILKEKMCYNFLAKLGNSDYSGFSESQNLSQVIFPISCRQTGK